MSTVRLRANDHDADDDDDDGQSHRLLLAGLHHMTDKEDRLRGAYGEDEGMIGIELSRSHRQREGHKLGICRRIGIS